ncbi:MAG: hypothetical protein A2138_22040 [Deltaproteobacteria bacterium RBG_16_71_12]|nr:MAG: hypothetical protein A2138_22040 [Deltaproteobacteria bacterium RBG_16_71_12]
MTDHRSDDGELLGIPELPVEEPGLLGTVRARRRFYWELVELRRRVGATPAALLADPRLGPALAAVRDAAQRDPVRVACLVDLGDPATGDDVEPLLRARDALARHDLDLDVWPQLADGATRFLNTSTAATFQARLLPLLDALEHTEDGADIGLSLDLEPRERLTRAAWALGAPEGGLVARARAAGGVAAALVRAAWDARQGHRDLIELARDLEARERPLHVAVMPPLSVTPGRDLLRHWALGCPAVDDEGVPLFGLQAAMCYASLARRMPGRRAATREHDKRTLALWAARHRTTHDAVVIGQTSTGILGDEPVYESADVLAEDVRAMHALGYSDIAVYALEGVLFGPRGVSDERFALRPDVERWLAASFGES